MHPLVRESACIEQQAAALSGEPRRPCRVSCLELGSLDLDVKQRMCQTEIRVDGIGVGRICPWE